MGQGHMVKTSLTVSKHSVLQHKAGEQRLVLGRCIHCNLILAVHSTWNAADPSEKTGELTHAVKKPVIQGKGKHTREKHFLYGPQSLPRCLSIIHINPSPSAPRPHHKLSEGHAWPIEVVLLKGSIPSHGQAVSQSCDATSKTGSLTHHGLGERSSQREEERHQPPASVNGRVHHVARMHGIGSNAVRGEAAVELVAEEDIAQFGPVVRQHGPVLMLGRREQVQVHLPA